MIFNDLSQQAAQHSSAQHSPQRATAAQRSAQQHRYSSSAAMQASAADKNPAQQPLKNRAAYCMPCKQQAAHSSAAKSKQRSPCHAQLKSSAQPKNCHTQHSSQKKSPKKG